MRICTKCGYSGYGKLCINREHGLMKKVKDKNNINMNNVRMCGYGL